MAERPPPEPLSGAEADTVSLLRRFEWLIAFVVLLALAGLVSGNIARGRFWAEEGYNFFTPFTGLDLGEQLGFLFRGQLQIWTNIAMSLAELAGLEAAPLVSTWFALLVTVVISTLIYAFRERIGLTRVTAAIFIAFYWTIPPAAETWATTISMQWHFSLLAALILAAPAGPQLRWVARGALLVAGLSGVPVGLLAPAFFFAAVLERNWERAIQGLILATCAALEAFLLVTYGTGAGREFDFNAFDFLKALAAQTIYAPLLGADFLNASLAGQLKSPSIAAFTWLGLALFIAPLVFGRDRKRIAILLFASLSCAGAGYLGMYDSSPDLAFSGSIAGRYFYVPALLNILAWIWALDGRLLQDRVSTAGRIIAAAAVAPLIAFHLTASQWRDAIFNGPSWAAEIRDMREGRDQELATWPPGWSLSHSPAPQE